MVVDSFFLEEKPKLVACGVDILDHADIAVTLDISGARVPFSLNGRLSSRYFVEFGCHVLLFREFLNSFVVEENLKPFLVDTNSAQDSGRFDVKLRSNSTDKIFQCAVHEIDSSEVFVFRDLAGNPGLHKETSDCWF